MEDQVGASQEFQTPGQLPREGNYYADPQGPRFNNPAEFDQGIANVMPPRPDFKAMRQQAMQNAIQQVTGQPPVEPQPKVVYVRRNLTLAELLLVFALSTGTVLLFQSGWNFITDVLPRIEIRDK